MINIFINPEHPALSIAIAVFIKSLSQDYEDEIYEIIPITVGDLAKNLVDVKFELNQEIITALQGYPEEEGTGENGDDDFFDLDEDDNDDNFASSANEEILQKLRQQNKESNAYYVFFGLYPQGQEEERIIFDFFENKADRVLLWADYHSWPENLVAYLKSQCSQVFIKKNARYSDLLREAGLEVPHDWLRVERAILEVDLDDPLVSRYWGAFLVSKSVGDNLAILKAQNCLFFSEMIDEIIYGQPDEEITHISSFFAPMLEATSRAIEKFSDQHPIFAEAKKLGRSVGYLDVGEIEDYFNLEDIMAQGLKKHPWLFVLIFQFEGQQFLKFVSTKIPVDSLTEYYVQAGINEEALLKLLNAELVRFKE